jgi:hypothetical protein
MGNSIAMAEQVLEQEEPVRFLSLSPLFLFVSAARQWWF